MFINMAALINKKIDEGLIDVTNDSSGVKSGTEALIGINGKGPLKLTTGSKDNDHSCPC